MFLFKNKPVNKILFVAPEAAPFVKAGGLGGVMFALPRALRKLGYDARVMIPRYAGINLEKFNLEMELEGLQVPTDSTNENETQPPYLVCNVKKYTHSALNAAYVNDLDALIQKNQQISLWIHGHSHEFNETKIGKVLMVRNPLGYVSEGEGEEFRRDYVVGV